MTKILRICLFALVAMIPALGAHAQERAQVVASCSGLPSIYTPGLLGIPVIDVTGTACSSATGGGGGGGTSSNFAAAFPAAGTAAGCEFLTSPPTFTTNGQMQPCTVDSSGNVNVNVKAGGISGNVSNGSNGVAPTSTNLPTVAYNYTWNGTSWDAMTKGTLSIANSMSVTPATSSAWVLGASSASIGNINNITGTQTLPTGASTSALQPTNAAQGSTTSGQTGHLMEAAVTTAAPSYTTAQTSPLSLDLAGNLRINCTTGCAGSGGTSSSFNATYPSTGTAAGFEYLTSAPTYSTNGQMVAPQVDNHGNVDVNIQAGSALASAPGTAPGGSNTVQTQGDVAGIPYPGTAKSYPMPITTAATRTYGTNTAISPDQSGTASTGYTAVSIMRANGSSAQLGSFRFSYQGSTAGVTGTAYIFPKLPATACQDGAAYSPSAADWALSPIILNFTLAIPGTGGTGTPINTATLPIYDAITNADGTPAKNVYICVVQAPGFVVASTTNVFEETLTVLQAN